MERNFDLALQQVTFDEDDLSPSNELDSFSNIVHYDSHFSQGGTSCTSALTYAQSYSTRDIVHVSRPRTVVQPSRVKTSQIYRDSVCSYNYPTLTEEQHHLALINPDDSYITRKSCKILPTDIRTLFQVSANTTSIKKKRTIRLRKPHIMANSAPGSLDSSVPEVEGTQAFESVAEALHLQWSVIGDKKLTPASPEVVAQIVAEAEKKLKAQGKLPSTSATVPQVSWSASGPLTTPSSAVPQLNTSNNTSYSQSATNVSHGAIPLLNPSHDDNTPGNITPHSRELTSHSSSASSPDVQHQSADGCMSPELIRIPADSIKTTKERMSWFGGGGKAPQTTPPQTAPVKDKPLAGGVTENWRQGADDSGSEVGSVLGEGSISSAASEMDMSTQSDTDNFIKSLPPVKQVDLSMFATKPKVERSYSPPVKETSFRPLLTNTTASLPVMTDNTSIVSDTSKWSANSLDESTSPFSDSGIIGVEIESPKSEFQPSKLFTSTPNKAKFVIPQAGPLFKHLHKITPKKPPVTSEIRPGTKQLDVVLREKAKLEGQLEMLSEEAQVTRLERAELQAQLASLRLQLDSNRTSGIDAQCENLKAELEKIQRSKGLLEQSLGSAHKFLEEKNAEFAIQMEELRISQEVNDKLQTRTKEIRDDVRAKEMTIQALKNKIAELYVEVQTALQAKMEADNEARISKNDLVALINTKDWYQQQLQAAQVARASLQHELTTLQAQVSSQGSIIERLKMENAKLHQQMKDMQQKALKDKEMLAKHLEHIESDMMDREAAFQEINREKMLMEDTFDTKLQTVEQERSRVNALMHLTSELEAHLDKAQGDLKKKQSQINLLESEQIDLMKKLALSQECVIERDQIVEELQQKLIQVEASLKAFQTSLGEKESEIWKLREDKAAIEISLQAAKEEKQTVDKALASLKNDMGKVEKSFRHMKQELGNRASEFNDLKKESIQLQEELLVSRECLEKEKKGNHIVEKEREDRQTLVDGMRTQKIHLEEEVKFLNVELETQRGSGEENNKKLQVLESELSSVKQKLAQTEQQLEEANSKITASTTQQLPALEELQNENDELRDTLKKSEKQHHKDLTKQKAKVAKANVDLKSLQNELTERQSLLESNVDLLAGKLREITAEKEKMETELSMAHRKYDLSMLQQQDQLKTELQCIAAELESTKLQKQALESELQELQRMKEVEVQDYSQQLSALEAEIMRVQESQADSEALERDNQKLSLELEKEKGRVAGLMQTNTSLKDHISELEDALARRESALVDLQSLTAEAARDREREDEEKKRLAQQLEHALKQERESQRDLRKQIGTKISENKKIKRHLDAVKTEREGVQQDLDHRSNEVDNLRRELDNSKDLQLVQSGQVTSLDTENKSLVHQLDRVQRELTDNLAREPIIQEQIMSLQWHLEQKCGEVEAVQNQRSLCEQRQGLEIEDLHKTVQGQHNELENLKQELLVARQERSHTQTEMSQLRATLKASVQHHKLTKKLNERSDEENGTQEMSTQVDTRDLPIIPPLPFDLDSVEKLLQDSTIKALESKPLDNLQTCLSSLRSEITGLQKQMDNHISMVETSTQSWDSVENQVNELRRIVKTINGTSTMTNGQALDSVSGAAVTGIIDI